MAGLNNFSGLRGIPSCLVSGDGVIGHVNNDPEHESSIKEYRLRIGWFVLEKYTRERIVHYL